MEDIETRGGDMPSSEEVNQILETEGSFNPQEERDFFRKFDEGKLSSREKWIGLARLAASEVPEGEDINDETVSREIVRGV